MEHKTVKTVLSLLVSGTLSDHVVKLKKGVEKCCGKNINIDIDDVFFGDTAVAIGTKQIQIYLNVDHIATICLMATLCNSNWVEDEEHLDDLWSIIVGYCIYSANTSGQKKGQNLEEVGLSISDLIIMIDNLTDIGTIEMVSCLLLYHEISHVLYNNKGCGACKYCSATRQLKALLKQTDIESRLPTYDQVSTLFDKISIMKGMGDLTSKIASGSISQIDGHVRESILQGWSAHKHFLKYHSRENYNTYTGNLAEEIFCDLMSSVIHLWHTEEEDFGEVAEGIDQVLALNTNYRVLASFGTTLADEVINKPGFIGSVMHGYRMSVFLELKQRLSTKNSGSIPHFPKTEIHQFWSERGYPLCELINNKSKEEYFRMNEMLKSS